MTGYVGMILPLANKDNDSTSTLSVIMPIKDISGNAQLGYADLSNEDAVKVPYLPTPRHFVTLIQHQLGRHYAWGAGRPFGEDPNVFYNDSSSEMKNLFTPFGMYLPRHSTDQVEQNEVPGRADDYTHTTDATGTQINTTIEQRITYLQEKGHPYMTIIGGQGLYLGNYANINDPTKTKVPLAYLNPFGIRPWDSTVPGHDRRAVIEKAVILPLLPSYPEDPELTSFISPTRGAFKLMYLDDIVNSTTPDASASTATPTMMMALVNNEKSANNKLDINNLMAQ